MGYIIIILLIIGVIKLIVSGLANLAYNIFTLSFLPDAIGMFDGKVTTTIIPIIGPLLGVLLNYIVAAFINLIDFFLWFIYWIPGVKQIIDIIYRSPDLVERIMPDLFGAHRNFITHSIFNPVFLVFLLITFIISKVLSNTDIGESILFILMIIGFSFACHLLADTMPKSWVGFANIKIQVSTVSFSLRPLLSKLWLYINAFFCIKATYKITYKEDLVDNN